jgi:hypothetical protein
MKPRSGNVVKGTALTTGLFVSLLAPWVTHGVGLVQSGVGIDLGTGYDDQVLVLLATCCSWLASEVRMRLIARQEADDAVNEGGAAPPGGPFSVGVRL